jgi:hypothetical protein
MPIVNPQTGQAAVPGYPNATNVSGSPTPGSGTLDAQQQALNELLSQVQPALDANNAAYAGYASQLQGLPGQLAQTDAYQQAMAGFQQASLGIEGQKLGLQGESLGIQNQANQQQQGIEQRQYGLQQTQYPEQYAEAAFNYGQNSKQLQGSLAANGTLNSGSSGTQQNALAQNYAWQQQDIGRAQGLSQLSQQSEQIGYGAQQAESGIAQQNLSLMAQQNGLSEQQVAEQLQYGLAQNQQSGITSTNQLLAQMGNLAAGDVSTTATALAPIAYASGLNPIAGG